jgi:histone deacetylase 6
MKKAAAQQRKPSPFEAIKAAKKKAMKRMGAGDGDMIVKDPFQNSLDAKHVKRGETGVLYDGDMLKHENPWDGDHIECPDRLRRTRQRLEELDLLSKCTEIASRCATDDEIMLAHSQEHLDNLKKLVSNENLEEVKREAQPKSVYVNGESLHAARLAAGAAIDLATAVVRGSVQNGLALVRPPGHHASKNSVNGFCLCNNVAIAARHALNNLGVKRILIVDFDVHHGKSKFGQIVSS